jgi:hypothetical protein
MQAASPPCVATQPEDRHRLRQGETFVFADEFRGFDLGDRLGDVLIDDPGEKEDRQVHRDAEDVIEGKRAESGAQGKRPEDRDEQGEAARRRMGAGTAEEFAGWTPHHFPPPLPHPLEKLDELKAEIGQHAGDVGGADDAA